MIVAQRKAAMALLAQATAVELTHGLAQLGTLPEHADLRAAETGLVMVRGRIGGDGAPFNLGEATVTRAAVQLATRRGRLFLRARPRRRGKRGLRRCATRSGKAASIGRRRAARARRRSRPADGERAETARADRRHPGRLLHAGARGECRMTRLLRSCPRIRRSGRQRASGVPRRDGRDGAARHAADARARAGAACPAVARRRPRSRSRCSITRRRSGSTQTLGRQPDVAQWLRFHTGAPIVRDAKDAAFAFVCRPGQRCRTSNRFALGTAEYPDRSTTLVLQVERLRRRRLVTLSGPGIAGRTRLRAHPAARPIFAARLQRQSRAVPARRRPAVRDEDAVAALPRSTRVAAGG